MPIQQPQPQKKTIDPSRGNPSKQSIENNPPKKQQASPEIQSPTGPKKEGGDPNASRFKPEIDLGHGSPGAKDGAPAASTAKAGARAAGTKGEDEKLDDDDDDRPTLNSQTGEPNEGEGSRTAARRYDAAQAQYATSGKVEGAAKAAKQALDGPEGDELRRAEQTARGTQPLERVDPSEDK